MHFTNLFLQLFITFDLVFVSIIYVARANGKLCVMAIFATKILRRQYCIYAFKFHSASAVSAFLYNVFFSRNSRLKSKVIFILIAYTVSLLCSRFAGLLVSLPQTLVFFSRDYSDLSLLVTRARALRPRARVLN